MTEEIRQMFKNHEPQQDQPLAFTTDDLVAGGRKRRRKRTLGAAAGATVAVSALAVGMLALPGAFADPNEAADGDKPVEQPEYPFPDLEPLKEKEYYHFQTSDDVGAKSKAASEYGTAFADWFKENHDVTFEDWPDIRVFHDEIHKTDERNEEAPESETYTGEWLPRYGLGQTVHENGTPVETVSELVAWQDDGIAAIFDGQRYADAVSIEVYPRGGYKEGPGKEFGHLIDCEDTDFDVTLHQRDCETSTGPNGETIIEQTGSITQTPEDMISAKWRSVIVYRTDGTAVRVWDKIMNMATNDLSLLDDLEFENLGPDDNPYLSFEELTDLALSMPDAIVKG